MFPRQAFIFTTSSADGLGVEVGEGAGSVGCAEAMKQDESAYAKLAIAMTQRKFAAPPRIFTECFMGFPL
jgi:hypothetical protein